MYPLTAVISFNYIARGRCTLVPAECNRGFAGWLYLETAYTVRVGIGFKRSTPCAILIFFGIRFECSYLELIACSCFEWTYSIACSWGIFYSCNVYPLTAVISFYYIARSSCAFVPCQSNSGRWLALYLETAYTVRVGIGFKRSAPCAVLILVRVWFECSYLELIACSCFEWTYSIACSWGIFYSCNVYPLTAVISFYYIARSSCAFVPCQSNSGRWLALYLETAYTVRVCVGRNNRSVTACCCAFVRFHTELVVCRSCF